MPQYSPVFCGFITFICYLLTICPTVYVEGSGELIGATYLLGTPHPTGYPLYVLIARCLANFVPWGGPALQVNLATASIASIGVGLFVWILRDRGVNWIAASGAALCFGFSATYWGQATISEVYGLSIVFFILALRYGLQAIERKNERLFCLLAWLMGLGLTAHLNQALLAPALIFLILFRWNKILFRRRLLAKAFLSLIGGYSIVLYLPIRNGLGAGFHWGDISTAADLWAHLTGAIYSRSFFSLPVEGLLINARRFMTLFVEEWHVLLVPLIIWGGYCAFRKDQNLFLLSIFTVITNLLIALNYHRDPNGIAVFFLITFAVFSLFLGYGLDHIGSLPGKEWRRVVVTFSGVVCVLGSQWAKADLSQENLAYEYGRSVLGDLPKDAILITDGDDASYVLDYLIRIEKIRKDVSIYNRAGRGTDLLTVSDRMASPSKQFVIQRERESVLALGKRPLFYLVARRSPLPDYAFAPSGLVYRLVPKREVKDPMYEKEIDLNRAENGAQSLDPWIRKIASNYWFMIAERQRVDGDFQKSIDAYKQAALVAHDSRTVQYNIGLMLLRLNQIEAAENHARKAIKLDPFRSHPYKLLAKILEKKGDIEGARHLYKIAVSQSL
ncbi:MAG: DUF2723 domain-containing protein [Candidatus Latescibacterota bacterium]|nr:DUF2723 domain-containing protein [Candidatus Latescibacterota bacterium]